MIWKVPDDDSFNTPGPLTLSATVGTELATVIVFVARTEAAPSLSVAISVTTYVP